MSYSHISLYYCRKHGMKQVTFRSNYGKAHRGLITEDERLIASCTCPGSANGRLTQRAQIIAEGWEHSNCEN